MDRKGITGAGIAVHRVCHDGHGLADFSRDLQVKGLDKPTGVQYTNIQYT